MRPTTTSTRAAFPCAGSSDSNLVAVLLALDTATPLVTVALHDGERVVVEHSSDQPMKHGEHLAPLIARSLARMFGENLRQTKLASISPVTSATLSDLGLEPAAEAGVYTMPGLVQAILQAETTPADPA